MAFWKLEEARLVQVRSNASAADAEYVVVGTPGVPEGKVWIVTGFGYYPSVAETQTIQIEKVGRSGNNFAVLNPVSLALNPACATFIEQGMEYTLFPGEYIRVRRGGHTAGSNMVCYMQLVEIDLPIYTYDEPQEVKRQSRALSSIRSRLAAASSRGGTAPGSAPGSPVGGRGGGGTSIPV